MTLVNQAASKPIKHDFPIVSLPCNIYDTDGTEMGNIQIQNEEYVGIFAFNCNGKEVVNGSINQYVEKQTNMIEQFGFSSITFNTNAFPIEPGDYRPPIFSITMTANPGYQIPIDMEAINMLDQYWNGFSAFGLQFQIDADILLAPPTNLTLNFYITELSDISDDQSAAFCYMLDEMTMTLPYLNLFSFEKEVLSHSVNIGLYTDGVESGMGGSVQVTYPSSTGAITETLTSSSTLNVADLDQTHPFTATPVANEGYSLETFLGDGEVNITNLDELKDSYNFYFISEDAKWTGQGDQKSPYTISNEAQLSRLANLVNNGVSFENTYFQLTDNIRLSHSWTPIGNSTTAFAGNFDGQGHTIYGLNIDTDQDNQGLFGYVTGSIKNINLKSGVIQTTGSNVGSLVANLNGGNVENISSNIDVRGTDKVGGIVGNATGSQISMCTYSGYAFGNNVGGIAGSNGGTISRCMTNCYLSGTEKVGAIAAENSGTISDCEAKGTIDGKGNILLGTAGGTVTACSFYGTATDDTLKLSSSMTACWAVVNKRKIISTDLDDASWTEYWVVVKDMNRNLPMQKGLFWIDSDIASSTEKIQAALNGFELTVS